MKIHSPIISIFSLFVGLITPGETLAQVGVRTINNEAKMQGIDTIFGEGGKEPLIVFRLSNDSTDPNSIWEDFMADGIR